MIALTVAIIITAQLVFQVVMIYNHLVALRNQVDNSWSMVDVQLKRRYDLIPNLIQTVKSYAAHEKETLEKVTEARSRAIAVGGVGDQEGAENALSEALRSLFAVAENYPELRADQLFLKLQEQLIDIETTISHARQSYNNSVMNYNTGIQTFPNNIVAGWFGFDSRYYFDIKRTAYVPSKVDFSAGWLAG